ncbi:DUF4240 domain-containing protein [Myxococcota bacterium]|nr:DUF4240 domain-containing protein [Myxococcota bacterium]
MRREEFWQIIDKTRKKYPVGSDDQFFLLERLLCKMAPREILDFENIKNALMAEGSSFALHVATFILFSELSDELYEDMRAWLILSGEEVFTRITADPDSLVDLPINDPQAEIGGEGLLFAAEQAYVEVTNRDDFYKKLDPVREPFFKDPWPSTVQEYEALLPRVYGQWFNEQAIIANQDEDPEEEDE